MSTFKLSPTVTSLNDMSAIATQTSLPPNLVAFARGVIATLKLWPALRIAVEESWGGPESKQKRTWLASAVVDSFEEASKKNDVLPDAIYVEEMLLQVLADEFDVVLEDDSAKGVAEDIVRIWQEVMNEGRLESVTRAESLVEQLRGKKLSVQEKDASDEECAWDDEDDGESGESSGEGEEPPQLLDHPRKSRRDEPEVDEDGFTMVKGHGRR